MLPKKWVDMLKCFNETKYMSFLIKMKNFWEHIKKCGITLSNRM